VEELLEKRDSHSLTEAEDRELEAIMDEAEAVMLRRADALEERA